MKLPEGWKEVSIADILNKEQRAELRRFLGQNKDKSPMDLTGDLKQLFGKWREDLEGKGVLPEYLAYAFAFKLSEVGMNEMIDLLKRYESLLKEKEEAKKKSLKEVV